MSSQKVAVVTGSNKGIGYAIVQGLCEKFEGVVYLTARDVGRGELAVFKLKELGFKPVFHQLDITDQHSITKFKNHLMETHGGFDILVNNAAVYFENSDAPIYEQAETTAAVNYFSTLRLCQALFPLLRQNARIINLSSVLGHLSFIKSPELRAKFNDPLLTTAQLNELVEKFVEDCKIGVYKEEGWGDLPVVAYCVSKAALCALTKIHQIEFDLESPYRDISVNSVHPGYVATDMTNQKGDSDIWQGAEAALWLALEADQDIKGQFVWKDSTIAQWDSEQPPALY